MHIFGLLKVIDILSTVVLHEGHTLVDVQEENDDLETIDVLEKVTGSPSQAKAIKEEEEKMKAKESEIEQKKCLLQQLGFNDGVCFE
jgi:hypothetical protein